jgi:hypothetical protein
MDNAHNYKSYIKRSSSHTSRSYLQVNSPILGDVIPCCSLKSIRRFEEDVAFIVLSFLPASCSYLSQFTIQTLKTDAKYSAIRSSDTKFGTQPYIPGERNLHNHVCENLRSYTAGSNRCCSAEHRLPWTSPCVFVTRHEMNEKQETTKKKE